MLVKLSSDGQRLKFFIILATKTSRNLKFCFIKIAHHETYMKWLCPRAFAEFGRFSIERVSPHCKLWIAQEIEMELRTSLKKQPTHLSRNVDFEPCNAASWWARLQKFVQKLLEIVISPKSNRKLEVQLRSDEIL